MSYKEHQQEMKQRLKDGVKQLWVSKIPVYEEGKPVDIANFIGYPKGSTYVKEKK